MKRILQSEEFWIRAVVVAFFTGGTCLPMGSALEMPALHWLGLALMAPVAVIMTGLLLWIIYEYACGR